MSSTRRPTGRRTWRSDAWKVNAARRSTESRTRAGRAHTCTATNEKKARPPAGNVPLRVIELASFKRGSQLAPSLALKLSARPSSFMNSFSTQILFDTLVRERPARPQAKRKGFSSEDRVNDISENRIGAGQSLPNSSKIQEFSGQGSPNGSFGSAQSAKSSCHGCFRMVPDHSSR